jgi:cell division protein FtsQ
MWNNPRVMNMLSLAFVVAASIALIVAAVTHVARSPRFAIKRVVVTTPLKHVDPRFVERIIRTEFAGTYFTLNLKRAQASLARVPWVDSVSIRRVWPRSIEVKIVEHKAFARWNADLLVSEQAKVFAGTTAEALPQLNGPDGSENDVVKKFKQAQAALRTLGYSVQVMSLSPSYSLSAELREGPSIHFGREQFDTRLARLVEFGPQIRKMIGVQMDSLDLRYSRGIAVAMDMNEAARARAASARPPETKQP